MDFVGHEELLPLVVSVSKKKLVTLVACIKGVRKSERARYLKQRVMASAAAVDSSSSEALAISRPVRSQIIV